MKTRTISTKYAILFFITQLFPLFLCDLRYENLSSLGNFTLTHIYLVIWACITSSYLYICVKNVYYKHQYVTYRPIILQISFIMFILSVCIPYLPDTFPILSKWHVRFAMISTCLFTLQFYHFLAYLIKFDIIKTKITFYILTYTIAFESYLYVRYQGISTLMELSFVCIFACLLQYHMYQKS